MTTTTAMPEPEFHDAVAEEFDVVVIGAGLSGVGAAWHLQNDCPNRSFTILESRDAIGGTWDLFRYPGVRSDSDMYTLGFPFRPWREEKSIADGDAIRRYIQETAAENGIDRKIRFGQRVTEASWNSATARWTVSARTSDGIRRYRCRFLYVCSGYYDYAKGYQPHWPDMERFGGTIVHPQHWPQDLDYTGKKIVIIGSGATAVTLVPAMCDTAAHVTMLQRSPSYVFSLPARDKLGDWMRRRLPAQIAPRLTRSKAIMEAMLLYKLSRRFPGFIKRRLVRAAAAEMEGHVDAERDLTPDYDPWDQRLCFVPDGDLFKAIRSGKASIVTDHIERFTETGLLLKSERELPADIIVSATGLNLRLMGGMSMIVDGKPLDLSSTLTYRALMLSDVPNMAFTVGYTNASWTLKCSLTWEFVSRVLNHMERRKLDWVVPRREGVAASQRPLVDLSSGYIRRAEAGLPKQGAASPWKMRQNYIGDMLDTRFRRLQDGFLEFGREDRPD